MLGTEGFASASDTYERGRPGYPDDLIAELQRHWRLSSESRVLDVAAGTGKLTRQLQAVGAQCVALEPSAAMRAECRLAVPGVSVVGGSAEALPFADRTFSLVTAATAFHWFTPEVALHEMARVLKVNGVILLVWNERDATAPWAAALGELLREAGTPSLVQGDRVRSQFDGNPHFAPFTAWQGSHELLMSRSDLVDMVASRSYVRTLPEESRTRVIRQASQIVEALPEPILTPYTTFAYCAEVIAGPCACKGDSWSG